MTTSPPPSHWIIEIRK